MICDNCGADSKTSGVPWKVLSTPYLAGIVLCKSCCEAPAPTPETKKSDERVGDGKPI